MKGQGSLYKTAVKSFGINYVMGELQICNIYVKLK